MKNVICVVGTRPEAIKMAPVIKELKRRSWCNVITVLTAQHRELVDQVFEVFEISADVDLDLMTQGQTLASLTSKILVAADQVIDQYMPDLVVVQGDTTTVMAFAMSAFYRKVPVAHVEAGLRTGNIMSPFPEEMNRLVASRLSTFHFAPTEKASANLRQEGVDNSSVFITGNTVIDSLFDLLKGEKGIGCELGTKRRVLVTLHRRENIGGPLENICAALKELAANYPEVEFYYPVHPNPNVRSIVFKFLEGIKNIILDDPLDYFSFVREMSMSYIILTDSGGVQEEAPALGKPVLVLREDTERPEAVEFGVAKVVGCDKDVIINSVSKLLDSEDTYQSMAKGVSPYGDGLASKRIADILESNLCQKN